MKRYLVCFLVITSCFFINGLLGCNEQSRDVTIKEDLVTKARSELDFVGVRFTVENGIVTLKGQCATNKSKEKVLVTVRKLYGVKDVVSDISVAPIVIGTDNLLKQSVDSVLKKYPGVEAITKDSVVYLMGKIETDKISVLAKSINSLKPTRVENELKRY